jgi:zinc transporter ZupT
LLVGFVFFYLFDRCMDTILHTHHHHYHHHQFLAHESDICPTDIISHQHILREGEEQEDNSLATWFQRKCPKGLVPVLGICFHTFLDGIILSITFRKDIVTGWTTSFGLLLHQFPEGIVAFVLLVKSGYGRKGALLWGCLDALCIPMGAVIFFPIVRHVDSPLLGILLGGCAGTLVFIGATHLLPACHVEGKRGEDEY